MTQMRAGVYGRQSANKAKSIAEQITAGLAVIAENSWTHAGTYQDGSSASRYARKDRDDWQRAQDDIKDGALDILILWEASRGDRTLTTWSGLLDLCRAKGVLIYVISDGHLYDPRKARDWKTLATAGVDSAGESDLLSLRVKRGHAGAAAAGRPSHGPAPYGYRRTYDPATGELAGQEPDPDTAKVVREIFTRIAKGDAVSAITADFNERQVPTAVKAARWYRARLRDIASNRAYIGQRVLNGITTEGTWTPLVDEALFYAVQRVLTDPQRRTTRPGSAVHLLSYLATCEPCGSPLTAVNRRYRCLERGCVTIAQADTDKLVERMVLGKLAKPETYGALRQRGGDDDRAVLDARTEVGRLTDQLEIWRRSAAKGETSPASLAVIEAELTTQIKAAQRRVELAEVPVVLRAILEPGEDIQTRWKAALMAAKRRIVMHMAEIKVGRVTSPGSRGFDFTRLGQSRWAGDPQTWGEKWAEGGVE